MHKVIFINGSVQSKTGGELYNYKVIKYFEQNNIEYSHIALSRYPGLTKLSWVPILGDIFVSLFLAIILFPQKGIYIEDHYFSRYLLIANFVQRFIRRLPVITVLHLFEVYDSQDAFWLRRQLSALVEKSHLTFSSHVVATSPYSGRELQSLKFPAERVHVICPGIDREKFIKLPRKLNDTSLKILCVANYIPRKGGMILLEAFSKLDQNGCTLHMVGNPKKSRAFYKQLVGKVSELKLEAAVIFHDGADQENIKYLYSTSDIFVLPSFKETFGIVLLEAMHYGLPVITNNCTAMPDLISHGHNGLLVTPGDITALCQALDTLSSQPSLRKELGKKGQQQVAQAFHWDSTGADFLEVIKHVDSDIMLNTR